MSKPQAFLARSPMPVAAAELFAWHTREGAFQRLSPPWERTEVLEQGRSLAPGTRVVVRTHVGPVPQRLVAEHTEYVEGSHFQDRQVEGPFAEWVHTHRMVPDGERQSFLEDDIAYALPLGSLGSAVAGASVEKRIRRMFAYRHALTRADLERHAAFADRPRLEVAISGASGLLGQSLAPFLTTGGHRVRRLVRESGSVGTGKVRWDPARGELDLAALEGVDAVVHLAGAPISEGRWNPARKRLILESRQGPTRVLCEGLARLATRPRVLVSASAVGYYGDGGEATLDEESRSGTDFLAGVCREWEDATAPAREAGIRVVNLRIGVVLTSGGGALAKMLPAFQAGAGGRIGSGRQWMSWISLEDLVGMVHFALMREDVSGPLNATAPAPVRQEEFARTLGRVLHRPAVAPLPAFAVKALFGEMGEALLLGGARVMPARAGQLGFPFLHPELEACLRFTLGH